MQIVTLSDTQGKHLDLNIPDGEMLIHAGKSGREKQHLSMPVC